MKEHKSKEDIKESKCRSNEIIASISHELLQWVEQKVSGTDSE